MASDMILFEQKPDSSEGSYEDHVSVELIREYTAYLVVESIVLQQILAYLPVASGDLA